MLKAGEERPDTGYFKVSGSLGSLSDKLRMSLVLSLTEHVKHEQFSNFAAHELVSPTSIINVQQEPFPA